MTKKKNLGRGLDDLLNQHDTDLPFLSAYGEDERLSLDGGLPPSTSSTNFVELMAALQRLIVQQGEKLTKKSETEAEVEEYLTLKLVEEGVSLLVRSNNNMLPLVPTDLQQPGMIKGKISKSNKECEVIIVDWGVPCRRLIERLIEFFRINLS